MKNSKGQLLFQAIGGLLKGMWRLTLLLAYSLLKILEVLVSFLVKLTEKMLN